MKNKLKWRFILFLGLILVLIGSAIGCAPSPTEQDLQEAYQTGYNAGFTEGYNAGLTQSGPAPSPMPPLEPEPPPPPPSAISWDKAKDHIGDRTTVCGPVAGTKYGATSNGQPTWLNIGRDYPSSERFVVIIWGENRGNFPQPPESYYAGKTICVTGLIQEYQGIAQIEVTESSQINTQ